MKDVILVTGGAGYIGSHACKALSEAGYIPVCFDNFSTGWRDAVKFGPCFEGDLLDPDALYGAFKKYSPRAVMHFAASSQVGESIKNPGKYWRNNVQGSLNLVEAANANGCLNFVFSSTCAVYGEHDERVLDETCPQQPINAYGGSKRAIEEILSHFEMAHGVRHVIFRYFNVAGADPSGQIGEYHMPETHLIPVMLDTLVGKRENITVFGTDYATPDGTCIRDYVHVCDLVEAHVLGLELLLSRGRSAVFNLGTGHGFSVKDVIAHGKRITNQTIPVVYGPRRAGDCTKLVSGSERAQKVLGWKPHRSSLDQMIQDAWHWHRSPTYAR